MSYSDNINISHILWDIQQSGKNPVDIGHIKKSIYPHCTPGITQESKDRFVMKCLFDLQQSGNLILSERNKWQKLPSGVFMPMHVRLILSNDKCSISKLNNQQSEISNVDICFEIDEISRFINTVRERGEKSVSIGHLRICLAKVRNEKPFLPNSDEILHKYLTTLGEDGIIALPPVRMWHRSTSGVNLPSHIILNPQFNYSDNHTECDHEYESEIEWHPFLAENRDLFSDCDREILIAVNKWLHTKNGYTVLSPLNERSLEICGDEKTLGAKLFPSGLIFGWLNPALIGAYVPCPPLPCYPAFIRGLPLLVVENMHTTHSIAQWNMRKKQYSGVAYGKGAYIANHADMIKETMEICGAEGITYFGDLDPAGLSLPMLLAKQGLPIEPESRMYAYLLENGKRRALPVQPDILGLEEWIRGWLPLLASHIFEMWRQGVCVPQEGLGAEQLAWEFDDFCSINSH